MGHEIAVDRHENGPSSSPLTSTPGLGVRTAAKLLTNVLRISQACLPNAGLRDPASGCPDSQNRRRANAHDLALVALPRRRSDVRHAMLVVQQ